MGATCPYDIFREEKIVSQWRQLSVDESTELSDKVDEILRPLGLQTKLLVVEKANSIILFFVCITLSALQSLREKWSSGRLRVIVQSLFTFLAAANDTVRVERLIWSLKDYEQSFNLFSSKQSTQKFLLFISLLFYLNWLTYKFVLVSEKLAMLPQGAATKIASKVVCHFPSNHLKL